MTLSLTAFAAEAWIATGDEAEVRAAILAMGDSASNILIFDDATGRQVDIDLRMPVPTAAASPRGRGRPKLGVQAREVTLLPRHWEWLAGQPGGASITLRKLVEAARKTVDPRTAMDAAYQFMTAMAGDRPHYEAAIRALYKADAAAFEQAISGWPAAIRQHARDLAASALA